MRSFSPSVIALSIWTLFSIQASMAQNAEADALQSDLLTNQANAAVKQQKNKEAESLYLKATELNTKNGPAWTGLGRLTYTMGDVAKAKSFLQEGWACGDAGALRTLGALAMLEVNYAEFQKLLPDLMSQKDLDVEIRAMIVLYYKKIGRLSSANLDPVLAGMDFTQLAKVSKANLSILLEGYQTLGRNREADMIQAELKKRP